VGVAIGSVFTPRLRSIEESNPAILKGRDVVRRTVN
jgi:hypothetical protein